MIEIEVLEISGFRGAIFGMRNPFKNRSNSDSFEFGKSDWEDEIGKSINITRTYTNPMNGEQSLAFCNIVTLSDPESGNSRNAMLMRVIPISELEQKWVQALKERYPVKINEKVLDKVRKMYQ